MRARDIKRPKNLIAGAAILSAGGLIAKLLGALYRIPLTNLLGAEGIGLYHLVFPVYSLLLSASSSGIPTAVSRLISEKNKSGDSKGANRIFKIAYFSFAAAGLFLSLLLFFLSGALAQLQGSAEAAICYRMIAPAVFFVAQISVLRGYFQGHMDMTPTALSQVAEQSVKILFTLGVAVRFLPDVARAVSASILAVSISELATLSMLLVLYLYRKRKRAATAEEGGKREGALKTMAKVFAVSVPITIGSIILPLSGIIDSLLVMGIMGRYYNGSVMGVYGLLNGPVNSIISLPAVVTGAVAAAAVPAISGGNREGVKKKIELAFKLTLIISIPCAIGLFVFSGEIIRMLYPKLTFEEADLASLLLKTSSASVLFLSLTQTSVCILVAVKKGFTSAFNLLTAVLIKIALSYILLQNPSINIFGSAVSAAMCYFVAAMLNITFIRYYFGHGLIGVQTVTKPFLCSLSAIAFALGCFGLLKLFVPEKLSLVLSIGLSLPLFAFFCLRLEVFSDGEMRFFPFLKRFRRGDLPGG